MTHDDEPGNPGTQAQSSVTSQTPKAAPTEAFVPAPRWRTPMRKPAQIVPPAPGGPNSTEPLPASSQQQQPSPRRSGRGRLFIGALLIALLAGAAGGVGGALVSERGEEAEATVSDPDVGQVASSVLPGVVTLKIGNSGTGSGVVMRQDGYILTNSHVAAAGESSLGGPGIVAVFADGTQAPAKLVGRDASYDLAVVKVERTGLPTLTFGRTSDLKVGDPVIAVGAPLGLQSTVTTGIISALDRPVIAGSSSDQRSYINAVQTDAAINPGNSGGPLVDGRGQVVGINTAIARVPGSSSQAGGSIGLGFAIPSDTAKRTAQQLIADGKAQHPTMGVRVDETYSGQGARIGGVGSDPAVVPDGPGAKAGLKEGDVVLSMDGRRINSATMLIVQVRAKAVGETVRLLVRSEGAERTVPVTLGAADN